MSALSAYEALTNAAAGLLLSAVAVRLLFPLLGWPVTAPQAVGVSAFFFVLSFVRSYAIRRIFARLA